MVITEEEIAAITATKTTDEKTRESGVKLRNRLGTINQIIESNVEGEVGLLAADATWYKARIDGCPVKEPE